MLTIEQTVHRDWINLCESIKNFYQIREKQVAEYFGLETMTLDQFKERYPRQAIPVKSDMVHLLTDIDSIIQSVDIEKLHDILKEYPQNYSRSLVNRLFSIYKTADHIFESEIQGIIADVRIEITKGLNRLLKRAPSHLKQIQSLKSGTIPLPKQVYEPLETAITNINDSIRYATAMRDFLESIQLSAGLTSKGKQRKNQTSHHEWNAVVMEAVGFFSQPETGIKAACTDAARLLQALFPVTWSGPVDTLGERIYQRYYRTTNPV